MRHIFRIHVAGQGYTLYAGTLRHGFHQQPLDIVSGTVSAGYIRGQRRLDEMLHGRQPAWSMSLQRLDDRTGPVVVYGGRIRAADQHGRPGIVFLHGIELDGSDNLYPCVAAVLTRLSSGATWKLIRELEGLAKRSSEEAIAEFLTRTASGVESVHAGLAANGLGSTRNGASAEIAVIEHDCAGAGPVAWLTLAALQARATPPWEVFDSPGRNGNTETYVDPPRGRTVCASQLMLGTVARSEPAGWMHGGVPTRWHPEQPEPRRNRQVAPPLILPAPPVAQDQKLPAQAAPPIPAPSPRRPRNIFQRGSPKQETWGLPGVWGVRRWVLLWLGVNLILAGIAVAALIRSAGIVSTLEERVASAKMQAEQEQIRAEKNAQKASEESAQIAQLKSQAHGQADRFAEAKKRQEAAEEREQNARNSQAAAERRAQDAKKKQEEAVEDKKQLQRLAQEWKAQAEAKDGQARELKKQTKQLQKEAEELAARLENAEAQGPRQTDRANWYRRWARSSTGSQLPCVVFTGHRIEQGIGLLGLLAPDSPTTVLTAGLVPWGPSGLEATPTQAVAFSQDGQRVASCWGSSVRVWDAATGGQIHVVSGKPGGAISSLVFSPDGKTLAGGCGDGTVQFWDAGSGEERLALTGHAGLVTSVAFSPDGKYLASGSTDKIAILRVVKSKHPRPCKGPNCTVTSVAFSPDGSRLATSSADGTVLVWDAANREKFLPIAGQTGRINAVTFSPDGKYLATAGEDRSVKLWDAASGKPLGTLSGHTAEVTSLAFRPAGKRLVSGSKDGTVRLWDVSVVPPAAEPELLALRGNSRAVTSVAYSPDSLRLASAGTDGLVRIWWDEPPP
jgi:WD40 repeat protein